MHEIRRILVACDKFKGSLSAVAACAAMARGLARRCPQAVIEECPIADGGEGFAAALAGTLQGRWVEAPCHDALGRPIHASYLVAESAAGVVAVMEMSAASGLWRIAAHERDILRAHTFGTGELIRHAAGQEQVRRIILGIGGSATNDGGAGMAASLGVRFLDPDGFPLEPSPGVLARRLARIDGSERIPLPRVTVACDVTSPLLGPSGATRVFGPQKGADASSILVLEEVLEAMVKASGGEAAAALAGSGAAGGLGFGLVHFAGATLVPGFDLLAGLTGLSERVAAADLVVTGEGRFDAQTLTGKGPAGVARLARSHGKPVWMFCGQADPAVHGSRTFDRVVDLAATGLPIEILMADAARLLEEAAAACNSHAAHGAPDDPRHAGWFTCCNAGDYYLAISQYDHTMIHSALTYMSLDGVEHVTGKVDRRVLPIGNGIEIAGGGADQDLPPWTGSSQPTCQNIGRIIFRIPAGIAEPEGDHHIGEEVFRIPIELTFFPGGFLGFLRVKIPGLNALCHQGQHHRTVTPQAHLLVPQVEQGIV